VNVPVSIPDRSSSQPVPHVFILGSNLISPLVRADIQRLPQRSGTALRSTSTARLTRPSSASISTPSGDLVPVVILEDRFIACSTASADKSPPRLARKVPFRHGFFVVEVEIEVEGQRGGTGVG
jgi:hypothetical protein